MATVDSVKMFILNAKDKVVDFYEDNSLEIWIVADCILYAVVGGLYGYVVGSINGFGKGFTAGREDAITMHNAFGD